MSKRGVPFEEYIEKYNQKSHKMPLYMLKVGENTHFVFDEDELAKHTKDDEDSEYLEVFVKDDLETIEKHFNNLGLSALDFRKRFQGPTYKVNEKKSKTKAKTKTKTTKKKEDSVEMKPLFMVENGKDKHEFFSLQEVLDFIRQQASKGIYIQRYKGLGEMNPQQLWETTMDPERRTILQVSLEDAVEVERIFSMLMGDEVAPRREFIETFAHEVEDLDI